MLCNPARLNNDTLPEVLKQWEIIYSPPMENTDRFDADYLAKSIGSKWIDMNLFSINPNLVVVDQDQTALIFVVLAVITVKSKTWLQKNITRKRRIVARRQKMNWSKLIRMRLLPMLQKRFEFSVKTS